MTDPVNEHEAQPSPKRQRLTDGQALGVLAAYLISRTITNRVGLAVGPRLLRANAPWVIPLLNNSSLLLIQAGTGTSGDTGMLITTAIASVFMSTISGLILYWAGKRFGHKLAELAQRPGSPWASIWNPKQIRRAEHWMDRWGIVVVFFGRIIEYFTLPVLLVAGASEMRLRRFLIGHTAGAICFAGLFLWIGGAAQKRWPWLKDWISDVYGPWALRIGLVLLALAVLAILLNRRLDRRQPEGATTTPSQDPSSNPSETS